MTRWATTSIRALSTWRRPRCVALLECRPERSCWGTLVALPIHGCRRDMGFLLDSLNPAEPRGSGVKTWGSTRSLRASRRPVTSTWTSMPMSGTSRLRLLTTLPCWMRGCMADLMSTSPVHFSGQALSSGDHCGMCGQVG